MLQLTSLEKAVASLEEAFKEYDKTKNVFVRDACVERIECTYDLFYKLLKNHLEMSSANSEEVAGMSFKGIIRTAFGKALLRHGWDKWELYQKLGEADTFVYDEDEALDIISMLPAFLEEANYLLEQLKKQNTSN